ncbi:hypothetical protein HanRHA438_Chr07g0308361 [Helianthus annuus]|nr:hypothetical protein HanRHA438_Chr07g0308361 [Helianthus annuus]
MGEEYIVQPEQSEFVRMAAKFGAKIVPFGVVSEDDIAKGGESEDYIPCA